MANKGNTKKEGYDYLFDKGKELTSEAQAIIEKYKDKYKEQKIVYNTGLSFGIIVMEYHKWVKDIQQFLELNFKDKVEASFFGEIDNVPTFDWLEDNWYLDIDFIPRGFPQKIINETKKKLERLREIARQDLKIEHFPRISKKGKEIVRKNKFPYKLPRGTKWENFIIKFLDDETVFITVKQFEHTTNYREMGFMGKGKNPEPSEAWTLLKVLAKLQGELTMKDPEAKDKYKKQKELLSNSLENYFSLDYDPFYPYKDPIKKRKQRNSYKIKITLIPPPETSDEKVKINEDDDDRLGIKEYLDEQNQ